MIGRAEDMVASPLGRQLVYATLGFMTLDLYRRCGLGSPPGTAVLGPLETEQEAMPPVWRSNWSEVPAAEVSGVLRTMIADGHWRAVDDLSELRLLSWIAGETGSFGFRGEDEWLWGLTALAADELVPVAERLLSCPAASNWWRPMVRNDQRIVAFEGWPAFPGRCCP